MGLDRRHLPVALVAACLPLLLGWTLTASASCRLLVDAPPRCLLFGVPRPIAFAAGALPAGLVGLVLAVLAPGRWFDRLRARRLGALLCTPDRATLGWLVLVVGYAVLVGIPLLAGRVTHRPVAWFPLAVPLAPFLAMFAAAWVTTYLVPVPSWLGLVLTGVLVVLWVGTAVLQTVWFYAVAGLLGRTATILRRAVQSARS